MTTALRVACISCGDVDVPIERGRLVVGMTASEAGTALHFDCPRCATVGQATLDDRAATLLMAAGITMVTSPVPQHPVGEAPGSI
jgi:hypothetical protein